MENYKCDYCSSNRAESRVVGYDNRAHYFYACKECFEDYLEDC